MANKYEGPDSCYARREGVWVPGYGVNADTAPSIAALILYDLSRGRTYNRRCQIIPMTRLLAIKRLAYLKTLARKHSPSDAPEVYRLVDYVLRYWKLPEWAARKFWLAGNARRAAEIRNALIRRGILPAGPAARRRAAAAA